MQFRSSWHSYERLAQSGEYGIVLESDGSVHERASRLAALFIDTVGGRKTVVDLGCGTGFPGLLVAPHVGRLLAVDASPSMLAQAKASARQLGLSNWHPIHSLADELPLPDRYADAVIMSGFLGSIEHSEGVLAESRRIARPGAVIATLDQDFEARLADGLTGTNWALRMDGKSLIFSRTTTHTNPDRFESNTRKLRPGTLTDCPADREAAWNGLRAEEIEDEWIEVERQWRPDTLRALFCKHGFLLRRQETLRTGNIPLIFSVFE